MLRGNCVELSGVGCGTERACGFGATRNVPSYSNAAPYRGRTRGQGKGQGMGRRGQRTGKARRARGGRRHGKTAIPSSTATPPTEIAGNDMFLPTMQFPIALHSREDQPFGAVESEDQPADPKPGSDSENISPMRQPTRVGTRVATVDAARCIGCGACVAVCPMEAITVDAIAEIEISNCAGCGVCVDACPQQAITLERK